MPKWAMSKIGALGSALMATIGPSWAGHCTDRSRNQQMDSPITPRCALLPPPP